MERLTELKDVPRKLKTDGGEMDRLFASLWGPLCRYEGALERMFKTGSAADAIRSCEEVLEILKKYEVKEER